MHTCITCSIRYNSHIGILGYIALGQQNTRLGSMTKIFIKISLQINLYQFSKKMKVQVEFWGICLMIL